MFGSIYIGMSGLAAYSRGLQQISNNVANLNAQGFKGSTVSFSNLLGSGDLSGGHGVQNAPEHLNFAQGELRQTDRDLDMAVQGNGFLMLMRGKDTFYTRTGSFEVDKDGFIVLTGTDYRLATLNDASGRPQTCRSTSRGPIRPRRRPRFPLPGSSRPTPPRRPRSATSPSSTRMAASTSGR